MLQSITAVISKEKIEMTKQQQLFEYIQFTFGTKPFLTYKLDDYAAMNGLSKGSLSGALDGLKRKGLLINGQAHLTSNYRIQKTWQVAPQ